LECAGDCGLKMLIVAVLQRAQTSIPKRQSIGATQQQVQCFGGLNESPLRAHHGDRLRESFECLREQRQLVLAVIHDPLKTRRTDDVRRKPPQ
jgi:hypothetical protein